MHDSPSSLTLSSLNSSALQDHHLTANPSTHNIATSIMFYIFALALMVPFFGVVTVSNLILAGVGAAALIAGITTGIYFGINSKRDMEVDEVASLSSLDLSGEQLDALPRSHREALLLLRAFSSHLDTAAPLTSADATLLHEAAAEAPETSYYQMPANTRWPELEGLIGGESSEGISLYAPSGSSVESVREGMYRALGNTAHLIATEAPGMVDDMGAVAVVEKFTAILQDPSGVDVLPNLPEHLRKAHAAHITLRVATTPGLEDSLPLSSAAALETSAIGRRSVIFPESTVTDGFSTPRITSGVMVDSSSTLLAGGVLLVAVVVGYFLGRTSMRRATVGGAK